MNRPKDEQDALNLLRQVPPPNPLRQEAARRTYLQQAAQWRAERMARGRFTGRPRLAYLRPLVMALLLVGLILVGVSGTVYAADQARPGDPLYPLDRSLETLQLRLTRNPQRATALRLACAEERLSEAESLATSGDVANLEIALNAYVTTLLSLPPSPVLDQTLSHHEMRLRQLWDHTPERARRGLERALDAVSKERSAPPMPPAPSHHPTPAPHSTPAAPSDSRHGPPEDRPGKETTRTPGRPDDTGPREDEKNKDARPPKGHPKGKE